MCVIAGTILVVIVGIGSIIDASSPPKTVVMRSQLDGHVCGMVHYPHCPPNFYTCEDVYMMSWVCVPEPGPLPKQLCTWECNTILDDSTGRVIETTDCTCVSDTVGRDQWHPEMLYTWTCTSPHEYESLTYGQLPSEWSCKKSPILDTSTVAP